MYQIFIILILVAMLAMIIGLIKPGVVLFKSSNPSRGKVLAYTWLTIIASGVLFNLTMPPEVKAEMDAKQKVTDAVEAEKEAAEAANDAAEAAEEQSKKQAEEDAERRAKGRESAKILFDYFNKYPGNYRKGEFEQDLVDGEMLYECKANGKYPLYFGWIEIKSTIYAGYAVPKDDKPSKLYMWAVDYGDSFKLSFKGEEYIEGLRTQISTSFGCNPPEAKVLLGQN